MKAPKELHNCLDLMFSRMKNMADKREKFSTTKTKNTPCRDAVVLFPSPIKSKFKGLEIEIFEINL